MTVASVKGSTVSGVSKEVISMGEDEVVEVWEAEETGAASDTNGLENGEDGAWGKFKTRSRGSLSQQGAVNKAVAVIEFSEEGRFWFSDLFPQM